MMKKLRILVLLMILAFSFSVKAEVLLEIDCQRKEISEEKSVSCDVNILYETEGITDIEFNYQTNLDVSFKAMNGFTMNDNNGKITIHTDKTLYDEIMNATKIMEFTLSTNDNVGTKENFMISNVIINKNNDIRVDGVKEEFNITKSPTILDNVCTLDSITVEKEKISDFNKDKLEYRGINVTNEMIFIDAVRTSSKSSATGLGNVRVPKGETIERDITVTAEDGTVKIYKLFITNTTPKEEIEDEVKPDEVEKSSDKSLKLLEIYQDDKKLDIEFDDSKQVYNIEISDEVAKKLTIKATLNDDKASFVKNYGPRDIKLIYGYYKEYLKILAENNEERVITLNINYVDNRNKDNTLSSLKINGVEVDLTSDKLEVKVPNNAKKINIEAIPTSDKSTVTFEEVELILGDNEVKVQVTSEDGETKEYDVNVIMEEEKVVLDSITITGYNLGFRKEKKEYNLKINGDTNTLDIIINPSSLKYNILNNKDLKDKDKVTIMVSDDEGSYEYTINIQKESSSIDLICYGVFGLGVIALVISIIYYVKKKK